MTRFLKFACLWLATCSLAFLAPAQFLQHRRKAFRGTTTVGTSPGLTGILFWLSGQTNGNDSSTNARHFTETGTIAHPSGKVGNAFELGASEFLSIANAAWQTPSGSFTIALWYKPVDATPTTDKGILNKWNTSANRSILIRQMTTGLTNFIVSGDGLASTAPTTSTTTLADGVYSSLVFVFTASTSVQIYVDGVAQTANTTSIPSSAYTSTSGLNIGVYSAEFATGEYDSITMYSTAWSAANVAWFHNGTAGATGPGTGNGRAFTDL